MATNPNGPHNNYVGAIYYTSTATGCPFCAETKITGGTWACGMQGGRQVQSICSKTNGPHNNVVGAKFIPGGIGCPFCGETTTKSANGLLSWACGMRGPTGQVDSICNKLGKSAAPAVVASGPKLLDPKENRIGNMVLWDARCPFCRRETKDGLSPCGWRCETNGNAYLSPIQAKMLAVCTKPSPLTIMPPTEEKIIRPTINCPACGAYCAHKHRIGCKAIATC